MECPTQRSSGFSVHKGVGSIKPFEVFSLSPDGGSNLDRIYCMDYLDFLHNLPEASADLILTDPPYGIHYINHFSKNQHHMLAGDDGIDYASLAMECYRILKNNAHAYFFTRFDQYPEHFKKLQKAGFSIKNCLVIEKGTIGGIGDLLGSFANNSEWVIFCQKGRRKFSNSKLLKNRNGGQKSKSRNMIAEYKTRLNACWFRDDYPKATYNSSTLKKYGIRHPTVKNVECLEWLIRLSTERGEVVIDPFMGTASTALAALRTGRRFLGSEIETDYFKISKNRILEQVEILKGGASHEPGCNETTLSFTGRV